MSATGIRLVIVAVGTVELAVTATAVSVYKDNLIIQILLNLLFSLLLLLYLSYVVVVIVVVDIYLGI